MVIGAGQLDNATKSTRLLSRLEVGPATRIAWFLLLTVAMAVATHHAAVLAHEYAHSIVAWLLGLKADPGQLRWGPPTLVNALTLYGIGENVDCARAFAAGRTASVAVVAAAGPLVANGGLYLLSRFISDHGRRRWSPAAALALYWFTVMNLANVFDYVPVRLFAAGDMAHFSQGLDVSPAVVGILLTPWVLVALVDLYRTVLPRLYTVAELDRAERNGTFVLTTILMFGYFGAVGLQAADPISRGLSAASLAAVPIVLALCRPRLAWVQSRCLRVSSTQAGYQPAA